MQLYLMWKGFVSYSTTLNRWSRCRIFFETNARDVSNDNVSVSSNKSIIRTDRVECDNFTKFNVTTDKRKSGDRCANAAQSIDCGMTEKSIIRQTRDHYTAIHPTQKPVRLLERLLMLCIPKQKQNVVVADFFAGSFSCAEACHNLGLDFVGIEIDKEYYEAGLRRIQGLKGCAVWFLWTVSKQRSVDCRTLFAYCFYPVSFWSYPNPKYPVSFWDSSRFVLPIICGA